MIGDNRTARVVNGSLVWTTNAPLPLVDLNAPNPPPIVLPTFAPSKAVRWTLTADDPHARFRATTVRETPAQQADPHVRAVYLERTDDPAPSVALAVSLGVSRVVQNYDGMMPDLADAVPVWAKTAAACRAAGLVFLACVEVYPPTGADYVFAFTNQCRFKGYGAALWFPYYRDILTVNPPTYAWTEQAVLDQQGAMWSAMLQSLTVPELILRFTQDRGDGLDGVVAWPSFAQSAARMDAAAIGPDIPPSPPVTGDNLVCLASALSR